MNIEPEVVNIPLFSLNVTDGGVVWLLKVIKGEVKVLPHCMVMRFVAMFIELPAGRSATVVDLEVVVVARDSRRRAVGRHDAVARTLGSCLSR